MMKMILGLGVLVFAMGAFAQAPSTEEAQANPSYDQSNENKGDQKRGDWKPTEAPSAAPVNPSATETGSPSAPTSTEPTPHKAKAHNHKAKKAKKAKSSHAKKSKKKHKKHGA